MHTSLNIPSTALGEMRPRCPSARRFLAQFNDDPLRRTACDLIEFGLRPVPEENYRWFALGYTNGAELAAKNPEVASRQAFNLGHVVRQIIIAHDASRQIPGRNVLLPLQTIAKETTEHPCLLLRPRLAGLGPEATAAWWFQRSIEAGILAWNQGDLLAGHARAGIERLSKSQFFLGTRLAAHQQMKLGQRMPALIAFTAFCYADTPREREVLTAQALKLYRKLGRFRLSPRRWIVEGFRMGRELVQTDDTTRKAMFAEYGPARMESVFLLLRRHLGTDPSGWTDDSVYEGTVQFWRAHFAELRDTRYRPTRIEAIRALFDFAFWMGILAEVHLARSR